MSWVVLYCRGKYYLSNGFRASEIGDCFNHDDALTYARNHRYRLRFEANRQTQKMLDENHKPVQKIGVVSFD